MKFRGKRQSLLEALTIVGSVVAPRSIKPILQNLRLVVEPGGATLLATDLEVAIRYRVDLEEVEEGGDILLPVQRLLGIFREADGEEVTFASDDRAMRISCGKGSFKVLGEDPEDFPVVPSFDDEKSFVLEKDPFRLLIRKTTFATAREKTRYAFNGVRFEVEGDIARMVATDGKRMAVKSVGIDNPQDIKAGHIIPTKGLQTFDKVLTEADDQVRINLEDRQVMIRTGCAEVSSRLVEGAFPRYDAVIPKTTVLSASFEKQELLSALKQAAILTNDESRSVRLSFSDGKLVLTSRAMDVGEARVELPTEVDGDAIDVAFNPDFLVEGIKVIDAERLKISVSGKDTPARIDGEEDFVYVVMPVTLRSG